MAENEIQTRLTADDELSPKLRDAADSTKELGEQTRRAGDETRGTNEALGESTNKLGGMSDELGRTVASWASFAAVLGTVTAGLRDVAAAANAAVEAAQGVGQNIQGLATNVGGEVADEALKVINDVSLRSGFDVAGRNALIETIAAQTDVQPDLTPEQLRESIQNFALLQRSTGQGGRATFNLVRQAESTLGVDQRRAVDIASSLLNAGLDASAAEDLLQRAGETGGEDFLALVLAASSELDLNRAGRTLPTLVGALTQTDESGRLSPGLRSAGVTQEQNLPERLFALDAARQSGRISQAQFENLIGGTQNLRIVNPLLRADIEQGRALLSDADVIADIERQRESEFVRVSERARQRELREQVAEENSVLRELGESSSEVGTSLTERGAGSRVLGFIQSVLEHSSGGTPLGGHPGLGRDPTSLRHDARRLIGELDQVGFDTGGGGVTINLSVNFNEGWFVRGDPAVDDLSGPEGRTRGQ